jgi:uncharacterized protein YdhG (YjbR/CyaY superfamily)
LQYPPHDIHRNPKGGGLLHINYSSVGLVPHQANPPIISKEEIMHPVPPIIEEYLNTFPSEIRERLEDIRHTILDQDPDITESFAYKMPAYRYAEKPLVYFAGFKNHIGLYATPEGQSPFYESLKAYKQGKGSVQFPHNEPLPLELIAEIVRFKLQLLNKRKN